MKCDPFQISVLPGDGIGIDVTAEAVKVLRALHGDFRLNLAEYPCGAECYRRTASASRQACSVDSGRSAPVRR